MRRKPHALFVTLVALAAPLASSAQSPPAPLCVISFAADKKLPARVEDSAAACLATAFKALTASTDGQLLLVGTADQVKDNVKGNGTERMLEDTSGEDLRFWDLPSYRAINTKAYLVRWKHAPAARIIPVTSLDASQTVAIYVLSADADWKTVFPKSVGIFEDPCTVKPCALPQEEKMRPQQRSPIGAVAKKP